MQKNIETPQSESSLVFAALKFLNDFVRAETPALSVMRVTLQGFSLETFVKRLSGYPFQRTINLNLISLPHSEASAT
ncbi:hypothetical protein TNCV_4076451, partial [Trichonephila clavipes]